MRAYIKNETIIVEAENEKDALAMKWVLRNDKDAIGAEHPYVFSTKFDDEPKFDQPNHGDLKNEFDTQVRSMIYVEDHQGYSKTYYKFETHSSLSVDEMKDVSHEPVGAGRISTSFKEFKRLMEVKGHDILNAKKVDSINDGSAIVKGATGNY